MRFEDTTDVIRPFPAVLTAPGQTATFSFTLNISAANAPDGYEIAFVPASAPFGSTNTNYGSGIILGFDYFFNGTGVSSIQVSEGSGVARGDISGNNLINAGSVTPGVTHSIRLTLARGVNNTAYSLFLDDNLLGSSTFVLNDARGINAIELDQSGSSGSSPAFATLDNLSVIPEPASAMMGLVGAAGLWWPRRARRRRS